MIAGDPVWWPKPPVMYLSSKYNLPKLYKPCKDYCITTYIYHRLGCGGI